MRKQVTLMLLALLLIVSCTKENLTPDPEILDYSGTYIGTGTFNPNSLVFKDTVTVRFDSINNYWLISSRKLRLSSPTVTSRTTQMLSLEPTEFVPGIVIRTEPSRDTIKNTHFGGEAFFTKTTLTLHYKLNGDFRSSYPIYNRTLVNEPINLTLTKI